MYETKKQMHIFEHTYTFREIMLPISCMTKAHTKQSPALDSKSTALQFNEKGENRKNVNSFIATESK